MVANDVSTTFVEVILRVELSTLKMISTQVVETSATSNNSSSQDYINPDDQQTTKNYSPITRFISMTHHFCTQDSFYKRKLHVALCRMDDREINRHLVLRKKQQSKQSKDLACRHLSTFGVPTHSSKPFIFIPPCVLHPVTQTTLKEDLVKLPEIYHYR